MGAALSLMICAALAAMFVIAVMEAGQRIKPGNDYDKGRRQRNVDREQRTR